MPHRADLRFHRFVAIAAVLAGGLSGSVLAAPAAVAAPTPLVVTTTADASVDGTCSDATPATLSLREALCQAQSLTDAAVTLPGGVVTLTAGALVYAPTSGGRTLTVTGAGRDATRIDAHGASRVLDLDPLGVGRVDVTVSAVTLTGGRPTLADPWWGGGAVVAGSAVAGAPDTLTLSSCRVTASTNVPAGISDQGAVGGGVQMSGGSLTVRDCLLDGSTATDAAGGAIAFVGVDPDDAVVVERSRFELNTSVGALGAGVTGGGGLFVAGDVDVTVTGSTFLGNRVTTTSGASAQGSAVLVESGTATVTGSTVVANTVTASAGTPSSFGALVLAHGQVTASRLAGNATTVGSTVTRDAVRGGATVPGNWWGCVDPAAATGCDTAPDAATLEPFARLALAASPTIDLPGRTSAISAAVTMSDGSAVPAALAAVLADVPLTWSTTAGSLAGSDATLGSDVAAGTTLTIAAGDPRVSLTVDGSTAGTTVTTAVPASIAAQPTAASVVEGTTATFSVGATGTPTPTVQWRTAAPGSSTWTDVPGATGTTLTVTGTTRALDGTRYVAVVQNGYGAPVTSLAATLEVRWGAETTADPVDVTVVAGQDAVFTSDAAGTPQPTTTWERSADGTTWAPVASATGTTLTLPAVAATDDGLRVRAVHTGETVARSAAARLTVQTPPTLSPVAGVTVADGGTAQLTTVVGGAPAPAVRWQRLVDGTWTDVPGGVGATLSVVVDPTFDGARYRAVATSVLVTGTVSVTSSEALLDVRYGPVVDVQPQPVTALAGASALLTAAAHGNPAPSVQWQTSADGTTWTDVPGATGVFYTRLLSASDDGLLVRARFTGHGAAETAPATLTVQTRPTLAPVADVTVVAGATAQLTTVVGGSPAPAVRWQRLVDGTWTDVPGGVGATLTVVGDASLDGARYRAVATSVLLDGTSTATSTEGVLHVLHGPVVDVHPVAVTGVVGGSALLTAAAHGNPAPTVQWQTSTDGTTWSDVPGATDVFWTRLLSASDDGLQVRARFTGHGVADTNPVTLTVQDAPTVTDPVATTVDAGGTATFTVGVTGLPTPTVQWQTSADGSTWTDVAGATGTTYTVTATDALHGSSYRAVAANVRGTATSAAATLGVRTPPAVSSPADVVTRPGEDATFTVTVSGRPAPDVTWETSTDGTAWTPVAGAVGTTLTVTADAADDGLLVRAVATSTLGSGPATVRSAPATLTVVPDPVEVAGPSVGAPVASVAGTPTTVTFVVLGSGLQGRWEESRDGGATWAPVGPSVATNTITGVASVRSLRSAAAPATRTAFTATFTPTRADDGMQLRLVVVDAAGETVLRPVTVSVAAAPSPSPSAAPGAAGSGSGTGSSAGSRATGTGGAVAGGRLSSTGSTVAPIAAAAGLLVVLGAAGALLGRRRRT
ncbi:hypothetical protein ACFO3K_14060 [Cellulomonas algicola]|uniref:hypothetical protein n=1 Tax=Cellulomonas algicola TaxID=2071633 RepID=UPI00360C25BF